MESRFDDVFPQELLRNDFNIKLLYFFHVICYLFNNMLHISIQVAIAQLGPGTGPGVGGGRGGIDKLEIIISVRIVIILSNFDKQKIGFDMRADT